MSDITIQSLATFDADNANDDEIREVIQFLISVSFWVYDYHLKKQVCILLQRDPESLTEDSETQIVISVLQQCLDQKFIEAQVATDEIVSSTTIHKKRGKNFYCIFFYPHKFFLLEKELEKEVSRLQSELQDAKVKF